MLAYQPKERWELKDLVKHEWCTTEPTFTDDELYAVMTDLHRDAVQKKMDDPKRRERIEHSQVKQKNTRGEAFVKEFQDLPVPVAHIPLPLMNCYIIQDGVNPIEFIDTAIDTANELRGTHEWDPSTYTVTITVTAADDEEDNLLGCMFKVVNRKGHNVVIVHRQNNPSLDFSAQNEVLQQIWRCASTKLEGPYFEDYEDNAYDYSGIDFFEDGIQVSA